MPQTAINHQNTVIYKIVCNDLNITEVYVGSTTDFKRRKCQHKNNCNNINAKPYNLKLYQFIRSNGGWINFTMLEIEKYPCNNSNESKLRERYYYEILNSKLNSLCPGKQLNGIKEYMKIYREENKEKIKEYHNKQIICECGCLVLLHHKARHKKSLKHIKIVNEIIS